MLTSQSKDMIKPTLVGQEISSMQVEGVVGGCTEQESDRLQSTPHTFILCMHTCKMYVVILAQGVPEYLACHPDLRTATFRCPVMVKSSLGCPNLES